MVIHCEALIGLIPPSENPQGKTQLERGAETLLQLTGREFAYPVSEVGSVRLVVDEAGPEETSGYLASANVEAVGTELRRLIRIRADVEVAPIADDSIDDEESEDGEDTDLADEQSVTDHLAYEATGLDLIFGTPDPLRDATEAAMYSFDEAIGTLFLCGILASPGDFVVEAIITEPQPPRFTFSNTPADIYDAVKKAKELHWPEIRRLAPSRVHDWVSTLPGWKERVGKDQAGRALAAFTHLLSSEVDSALLLIWALVGLEALYGTSGERLKKAILEKSELLLGPRLANKKVFDQMYDFRSRFVHGDLDLPFSHRAPADDESWTDYIVPMAETGFVATAMLVASLQELVERDWTSFALSKSIVGQRERS